MIGWWEGGAWGGMEKNGWGPVAACARPGCTRRGLQVLPCMTEAWSHPVPRHSADTSLQPHGAPWLLFPPPCPRTSSPSTPQVQLQWLQGSRPRVALHLPRRPALPVGPPGQLHAVPGRAHEDTHASVAPSTGSCLACQSHSLPRQRAVLKLVLLGTVITPWPSPHRDAHPPLLPACAHTHLL